MTAPARGTLRHGPTRLAPVVAGLWALAVAAGPVATGPASAGEALVAVAANVGPPMKEIAALFERAAGHRNVVSTGSTGKLYTQIRHGAPFEVFLAADRRHVALLEEEGLAVAGTRVTYALGRLTLWSRDPDLISGDGREVLRGGGFAHLALANPKTAPFGAAAVEVLERLGLWERLRSRVVQGENVGQAFQFVASGNAELGFVSLSQVLDPRVAGAGSRWDVPQTLHRPLEMDAVLLARGRENGAARAFLRFLQGPEARAVLARYGYGLPDRPPRRPGTRAETP